jgi:hypothetical protein
MRLALKTDHPGWSVKLQVATEEECNMHHAFNRGKSYFVHVVYEAHNPVKEKRRLKNAERRQAKPSQAKPSQAKPRKPNSKNSETLCQFLKSCNSL